MAPGGICHPRGLAGVVSFAKLTIGHKSVSGVAQKLTEFGVDRPEIAGLALLTAVILAFILLAGYFAAHFKGRSAVIWSAIAAGAQFVALVLPISVIALTGLADPHDLVLVSSGSALSTFRLFAEMSVVAGFTTLGVLSFLTQTKWKQCPACDARIPWRIKTCPACASSQTVSPKTRAKMEPGAYPRLKARTIHLPVELDDQLRRVARPLRKRFSMTEDAAVSQFIRKLVERFDGHFDQVDDDNPEHQ